MSQLNAQPLNPPKQPRSRRTLERIVRAALSLLDEKGPSGVTVQAVVARARSSVGSFYARFRGKEDLLEYLSSRVWEQALERWDAAMAARSWSEMSLEELSGGAVALLHDVRRSRVEQLRALDALSGSGSASDAFRDHLLRDLQSLFLERRGDMGHEAPELAIRLGLRAVMGLLEGGDGGENGETERDLLVREGRSLLLGYLVGGTRSTADPAQVDFFDVWG